MATETKRLLSRDDIRTMRKDIQILKKGGVLNQSEKNSNKEQSKKEVEVKTKSVEQNVQNLSNQVKVDVVEKNLSKKANSICLKILNLKILKKKIQKTRIPYHLVRLLILMWILVKRKNLWKMLKNL